MSCVQKPGRPALSVTILLFTLGAGLAVQAGELEDRFRDTLHRAEGGSATAMYSVGEMYELGMGTASDKTKAMGWYRSAADKGHPEGLYQIGYAYYWGKFGMDKDRRQAHAWFLRAAEAGSQAAMPYLSKMYRLGQGVPRDKAKAAVWSARAAQASNNLLSQPPAPEAKPKPRPAPVEPPPGPAPAVAQPVPPSKAKSAPTPIATTRPEPAATAQPASAVDRKQQQMQRLLASWWQKDGRPALYLPSRLTRCERDGDEGIACQSKARRSSLLGRPYHFAFKAYLETFDSQGRFAMRYWPVVTEVLPIPPGAYGEDAPEPPSEDQIRQRVERPAEELSCEMFRDTHMICSDDKGNELRFKRIDKQARLESREGDRQATHASLELGSQAPTAPAEKLPGDVVVEQQSAAAPEDETRSRPTGLRGRLLR